jgi:hypothetical protein
MQFHPPELQLGAISESTTTLASIPAGLHNHGYIIFVTAPGRYNRKPVWAK